MTQEEKAKRYDEALERARKLQENSILKKWLWNIFPELKESEDEKIRKAILAFIRQSSEVLDKQNQNNMIDWLEKQGEQKPIKMWHDVSEVPDEMQELLVEWESPDATWHDIAFYDAETKAFRHLKQPINNVTRWAYVSDILSQSVTKTSKQGWSDALERQGEKKPKKTSIWKHWKDGIAGNGEDKLIYLIKNYNDYLLSSCLGFECDYIELSELDNLLVERK